MNHRNELIQLPDGTLTEAWAEIETNRPKHLYNPPGQRRLSYRVGTYSSFLLRMLTRIQNQTVPSGIVGTTNPLENFNIGGDRELGVAVLKAWAIVGDILTFYQEKAINEGYILSAREAFSVQELVRTIGYRPKPCLASSTYLAFTLADAPGAPTQITIPAGPATAAQSVPTVSGQLPVTFETSETIVAQAAWNRITHYIPTQKVVQQLEPSCTGLRLQGVTTGLKVGSPLMLKGHKTSDWTVRYLQAIEPNRQQGYTFASWNNTSPALPPIPALKRFHVYAFQQQGKLFGYNAPDWKTVPEAVKLTVGSRKGGVYSSVGSGQPWTSMNGDLPNQPIGALAVDAGGYLFAGTPIGPYRSSDGGHTWQPILTGLSRRDVRAFAIAPEEQMFVGMASGAVYRSVDRGNTWEPLQGRLSTRNRRFSSKTVNTRLPKTIVRALAFVPSRGDDNASIYAGTDRGVFRFIEGGNAWLPENRGLPGYMSTTGNATVSVQVLALHSKTGTLYAGTDRGLFFLPQGKRCWRSCNRGLPGYQHRSPSVRQRLSGVFNRCRPSAETASTIRDIVLDTDFFDSCPDSSAPANHLNPALSLNSDVGGSVQPNPLSFTSNSTMVAPASTVGSESSSHAPFLLVATDTGVFRSSDGGRSWKSANRGLPSSRSDTPTGSTPIAVHALVAVQPSATASNCLFAATGQGVFLSRDRGASWKPANVELRPQFSLGLEYRGDLDHSPITEPLLAEFKKRGLSLSPKTTVTPIDVKHSKTLEHSDTLEPLDLSASDWQLFDPTTNLVYRISLTDHQLEMAQEVSLSDWDVRILSTNPASGMTVAASPFEGFRESEWPHFHLSNKSIDLDRRYSNIEVGSYVAIGQQMPHPLVGVFKITSVSTTSRSNFSRSGTITQLGVSPSELLPCFDLRQADVYFYSSSLPLFEPLEATFSPVQGDSIHVTGAFPDLPPGQAICLTGKRVGARIAVSLGGVFQLNPSRSTHVGLGNQAVTTLVVDTKGQLVAGTTEGVFRYVNQEWQAVAIDIRDVRVLTADNTGQLLVGTAEGIYRLVDRAFKPVGPPLSDVQDLTLDREGQIVAGTAEGIFRLTDTEWSLLGLGQQSVHTLVVSTQGHFYAGTSRGVFCRLAEQSTWQSLDNGLTNLDVTSLVFGNDERLYAGTFGGGVFEYDPVTSFWQAKNDGLTNRQIRTLIATVQHVLYVGTAGSGIFVSNDGGNNWSPIPWGISNDVLSLVEFGAQGIYAGTDSVAVLTSTNGFDRVRIEQPYLFDLAATYVPDLNRSTIAKHLRHQFQHHGHALAKFSTVTVLERERRWLIHNTSIGGDFFIQRIWGKLAVYSSTLLETLSSPQRFLDHSEIYNWQLKTPTGFSGEMVALSEELIAEPSADNFPDFSEIVRLQQAIVAQGQSSTSLLFESPLEVSYDPKTLILNANVAEATAGETVPREVLGSGNAATANQQFTLKKAPLTFLPAETQNDVQSTLTIKIESPPPSPISVASTNSTSLTAQKTAAVWQEVQSLYFSGPTNQDYTLRTDAKSRTIVKFGNGERGARLPSGIENVVASYRSGGGANSNLDRGRITLLKKRPAGVRAVTNPLPASGGTDPEPSKSSRRMAPLAVRTLERIVSFNDYEDFVRTFPGIGKVNVQVLNRGPISWIQIDIALMDGSTVPTHSVLYKELVNAIRNVQAIPQPFRVDSYQPLYFKVTARIQVASEMDTDSYIRLETTIRETLLHQYGFYQRQFAQEVTNSEITSTIQCIPGVMALELESLHLQGTSPVVMSVLPSSASVWNQTLERLLPTQLLILSPDGPDSISLKFGSRL